MKYRKINQLTKTRSDVKKSNLYLQYQKPFDYFLNPDIGHKNIQEVNSYYISDEEIKNSLRAILSEPMDSVSVLIGYQGIGKSTDIRYSYEITNNAIGFDDNNAAVIFPSFFNGFVLGQISDEEISIVKDVRSDLTKRIASVCSAIEEKFPELKEEFYSAEGRMKFYQFLKYTNPKATVKLNYIGEQTLEDKLETAKNEEYYIYIVTQLKYYLTSKKCSYNRIMIILDDIESLPYNYQEQLILQYLRFYTCMRNLPDIDDLDKKNNYVNLLVSVRPSTYKLLQNAKTVSAYSIAREIYKTKSVDMVQYFKQKYDGLPEEYKTENWRRAYNILITFSNKFEKKYSNMIKNLMCLDIRRTLQIYAKVLSNSFWISKEINSGSDQEEYAFNNITVIRALACGSNLVYMNNTETLIPNILYKTLEKDNSILFLYIISYFIMQRAGFWEYGENGVTKAELIRDFCDAFGMKNNMDKDMSEIICYLYYRGVISISKNSYGKKDVEGEISDHTFLYLSAKGLELWNMLAADSVLMELYREDTYQDLDNCKIYDFCSSYDLMLMNKQMVIFEKIYDILLELYLDEKEMIDSSIKNGSYDKYMSLFGEKLMVEHLMTGVDKSIQYSGKNSERLVVMSDELKSKIERTKRVYEN